MNDNNYRHCNHDINKHDDNIHLNFSSVISMRILLVLMPLAVMETLNDLASLKWSIR